MEDDEFVDEILLLSLSIVATDLLEIIETEEATLLQDHIREQRRLCRSLPADKTRPTWEGFCNRVSDRHFRRQFRMSHVVFTHLCNRLSSAVGENVFRPENAILEETRNSASNRARGGLIPGEVKTAISLRILAGGSYLDLMPLFYVSVPHIYVIFDEFLDWVLRAFNFPLAGYLQTEDWATLAAIAEPFSYSSNGSFNGIFGALDGLAVRISSPTLDEVTDPGNYYCRKGFFAVNVQAMCNRSRKFLWCYTSNKGSTHDSVAFSNSRLYSLLAQKVDQLENQGYFLVGDSAYNLTPFLLTPYTTEEVRQDPSHTCDTFNFFLSSSRIHIECAFGELVRRWGILWRTLPYNLAKCQRVIQVCILHNHIKDCDENEPDCDDLDVQDVQPRNDLDEQPRTNRRRQELPFPLVTDNNELDPGGRRSVTQEQYRARGEAIRRSIAIHLQLQGLQRPLHSGMQYNQFGHVYFE